MKMEIFPPEHAKYFIRIDRLQDFSSSRKLLKGKMGKLWPKKISILALLVRAHVCVKTHACVYFLFAGRSR